MENKKSTSQPNTPGSIRSPVISPIITKRNIGERQNSVSFPDIKTLTTCNNPKREGVRLSPPPVPVITPPVSPLPSLHTLSTPPAPKHHTTLPPPPLSLERKYKGTVHESTQTPLDILYDHIVRLTVRKLQTNITTSVKSENGNISEMTAVLMSKRCRPDSNRILDIAFFVSFATNTITQFNSMVDFRVSELVSPRRIIDTDLYGKLVYTDISGKRYSLINTLDIKSCPVTSVQCDNLFDYFKDKDKVTSLVRKIITKNIIKEYLLTGECIQCSDMYVSDRCRGHVLRECPDLMSTEDFQLCQKCEINYRLAKDNGELDDSVPETCCVCTEKQYHFDSESLCSNPAHSIHRSCINRMNENGDTRCPLCRGRRPNEDTFDTDDSD